MSEQHERLQAAMKRAGFLRPRDVRERYPDWNPNTFKSNANGNAPFGYAQAEVYGRAFGVDPTWLYKGTGSMGAAKENAVPLVGYVGAGAEAHFYAGADDPNEQVDAPGDLWSSDLRAASIRGESLGPILEDWLIFFGEERRGVPSDHLHQLCVVGLPNGQVLVKKIVPAKAEGLYHLRSNSGEGNLDDQEVVWSAKVKDMRPR
jgi:hypothetical protein